MLSNTNFIDNAEIWINLRERIRMVLLDPIFSPLIKLTHLGTRIELLYSNFISVPFYLSDVNDLFSLRKKKSQLHTRLVTILGFQWDRSSHATRFISFNINVNNQHVIDSSIWTTWCISSNPHIEMATSTDNRVVRPTTVNNEVFHNAIVTEINENRNDYLQTKRARNNQSRIRVDNDNNQQLCHYNQLEMDLKAVANGNTFQLCLHEHPILINAMNRFINTQFNQTLEHCKVCKERWWKDNEHHLDVTYT